VKKHKHKSKYKWAKRNLKKYVCLHHVDGRKIYGVLHDVTYEGVYLIPSEYHHHHHVSLNVEDGSFETADGQRAEDQDVTEVFFAPLFFPFAAVASFVAGTVLGAAIARPYGYYW
jgi:hypothetical protein